MKAPREVAAGARFCRALVMRGHGRAGHGRGGCRSGGAPWAPCESSVTAEVLARSGRVALAFCKVTPAALRGQGEGGSRVRDTPSGSREGAERGTGSG